MSTRTALAFPWPVGAGHTGRCIVLARMLRALGWRVVFVAGEDIAGRIADEGFETLPRAGHAPVRRTSGYLTITGPDEAFASVGLYRARSLADAVAADSALIDRVRPDVVITHMQPSCVLAARARDVPVLSVADADFLVTGANPWIPWVAQDVPLSPFPSIVPAVGEVAPELGVARASDLLLGDVTLIASVPELEQPAERYRAAAGLHYFGPLIWDPDRGALRSRLTRFGAPGRTKVYASVGGGAVTDLGALALDAARSSHWSTLFCGGLTEAGHETVAGHVLAHPFGGIDAGCAWADVVVCHGGHSTVLAGLLAGKPVVVVAGMSENEANGRAMVAATGAGLSLVETEQAGRRLRVKAEPTVEALQDAVTRVTTEPGFRERARELSQALVRRQGRQREVLEQAIHDLTARRSRTAMR